MYILDQITEEIKSQIRDSQQPETNVVISNEEIFVDLHFYLELDFVKDEPNYTDWFARHCELELNYDNIIAIHGATLCKSDFDKIISKVEKDSVC